ncbi:MAG: hypothetical protein ACW7DU_07735, partial [Paraglaciecola chathamensis]
MIFRLNNKISMMDKKSKQGTANRADLSSHCNVVSFDAFRKSKVTSLQTDNDIKMSKEEALK